MMGFVMSRTSYNEMQEGFMLKHNYILNSVCCIFSIATCTYAFIDKLVH